MERVERFMFMLSIYTIFMLINAIHLSYETEISGLTLSELENLLQNNAETESYYRADPYLETANLDTVKRRIQRLRIRNEPHKRRIQRMRGHRN